MRILLVHFASFIFWFFCDSWTARSCTGAKRSCYLGFLLRLAEVIEWLFRGLMSLSFGFAEYRIGVHIFAVVPTLRF